MLLEVYRILKGTYRGVLGSLDRRGGICVLLVFCLFYYFIRVRGLSTPFHPSSIHFDRNERSFSPSPDSDTASRALLATGGYPLSP
jgi:hypothetical protein